MKSRYIVRFGAAFGDTGELSASQISKNSAILRSVCVKITYETL